VEGHFFIRKLPIPEVEALFFDLKQSSTLKGAWFFMLKRASTQVDRLLCIPKKAALKALKITK
jgi:hypothetical protein